MKVAAILAEKGSEVVTVGPDATLIEVAGVLDQKRIGAVIVTASSGGVLGVLSERDITREMARKGASALDAKTSDCMTKDVVTVGPEASLDELMSCMTQRRVRHLPVMSGGELMGIVSIGDVVKRKIAMAEAEAEAMRSYITTG